MPLCARGEHTPADPGPADAVRDRMSLRKTVLIRVPQHPPPTNELSQNTAYGFATPDFAKATSRPRRSSFDWRASEGGDIRSRTANRLANRSSRVLRAIFDPGFVKRVAAFAAFAA